MDKLSSFSVEKQHKKASEILRKIYDSLLKKESPDLLVNSYQVYASMLNLSSLPLDFEAISDRFHYHLKKANLFLKEHNFLQNVTKNDKPSSFDFLNIDLFLDHIRSAHNIGSIIRTTEALRIGTIHFAKGMGYIDQKKILDTAMNTQDKVRCVKDSDLNLLKRPLIALETSLEAISVYDFIFPKEFSLLLGNEEYGLSRESLQEADFIIKIPMYGFKNSLNVACAYSLIAGEIRRQLEHGST